MIYIIGKGYLGTALAEHFANRGFDMKVIMRKDKWPVFRKEDTIINCAASGYRKAVYNTEQTVEDNFLLPVRLHKESNGANMIHFSSWTEESDPRNDYSHSKALATSYLEGKAHVCMTCSVWGGPYEDQSKFMMTFLRACRSGSLYNVYYPYHKRDFVHVDTFCDTVEHLASHKNYEKRYFATGRMRSFYEVYGTLFSISGKVFRNINIVEDLTITPNWTVENPFFEDTFREDLAKEWYRVCGS